MNTETVLIYPNTEPNIVALVDLPVPVVWHGEIVVCRWPLSTPLRSASFFLLVCWIECVVGATIIETRVSIGTGEGRNTEGRKTSEA